MSSSNALQSGWRAVVSLCAAVVLSACGERPAPKVPLRADSASKNPTNWVCRGLVDRFLGLPSATVKGASGTTAPLAGRWWVRGCELDLARDVVGKKELQIHLDGPGWYWIDFDEGDLELHQQVPFELSADVFGTIRFAYSEGVTSLWFEPTREANVHVKASTELDLHGASPWGSILRRIPLLPIRRMTAERLSDSAASAFGTQVQRGMTVTYDLARGQADMALGVLRLGETPRRVFEDGTAWIENDILYLPAGATQVFGPLEPLPLDIDVVVERGPGIEYRALCTRHMLSCFGAVASGNPDDIPSSVVIGGGALAGAGAQSTRLNIADCPYYLVISSADREATVVAFRLRASAS